MGSSSGFPGCCYWVALAGGLCHIRTALPPVNHHAAVRQVAEGGCMPAASGGSWPRGGLPARWILYFFPGYSKTTVFSHDFS